MDGEEKSLGNKEYYTQREVEAEEQREIYIIKIESESEEHR